MHQLSDDAHAVLCSWSALAGRWSWRLAEDSLPCECQVALRGVPGCCGYGTRRSRTPLHVEKLALPYYGS